jgi:hypothetical protein
MNTIYLQGHCINFKKKYVEVAKEAARKFPNGQLEFYAVSCVGVEDLCTKYAIDGYPSLYAIPANTNFKDRTLLVNHSFSLKVVENALNVLSNEPVDTKRRTTAENEKLEQNDDRDGDGDGNGGNVREDEEENDDGKTVKEEANGDDGGEEEEAIKADGDDGENRNKNENGDDEVKREEKNNGDDGDHKNGDDGGKGEENNNGDGGENNNGDDRQREDDDKTTNDRNPRTEHENDDKQSENDQDEEDNRGKGITFEEELERFKNGAQNSGSITMSSSSDRVGAEVAKALPKTMDKWKDVLRQKLKERRYQRLRESKSKPESLGKDGATDIMLANRKGTKEYTKRQKHLIAVIEKIRSHTRRKRRENPDEIKNQLLHGQLPFKKQVQPMKLAEHVPIISSVVPVSHEEELILDASLSFLMGLRIGVYKSDDPLPPKQKQALKDWLELLQISLPPEWALHETIGDLLHNFEYISKGKKELVTILSNHKFPRSKWSRSCSAKLGFSCGFWKLLHTMTVGIAEFRGGQDLILSGSVRPGTRVFSPLEAADTVREYLAYFFTCTECSKHFIGQYDQCDINRRCKRLTNDSRSASDADWKELAKWLWEFHNDVNVRLLHDKENKKRKRTEQSDQVQAIWPSITECVSCLNDDGTFNENAIFLHLEQTYWYVFALLTFVNRSNYAII